MWYQSLLQAILLSIKLVFSSMPEYVLILFGHIVKFLYWVLRQNPQKAEYVLIFTAGVYCAVRYCFSKTHTAVRRKAVKFCFLEETHTEAVTHVEARRCRRTHKENSTHQRP